MSESKKIELMLHEFGHVTDPSNECFKETILKYNGITDDPSSKMPALDFDLKEGLNDVRVHWTTSSKKVRPLKSTGRDTLSSIVACATETVLRSLLSRDLVGKDVVVFQVGHRDKETGHRKPGVLFPICLSVKPVPSCSTCIAHGIVSNAYFYPAERKLYIFLNKEHESKFPVVDQTVRGLF